MTNIKKYTYVIHNMSVQTFTCKQNWNKNYAIYPISILFFFPFFFFNILPLSFTSYLFFLFFFLPFFLSPFVLSFILLFIFFLSTEPTKSISWQIKMDHDPHEEKHCSGELTRYKVTFFTQ